MSCSTAELLPDAVTSTSIDLFQERRRVFFLYWCSSNWGTDAPGGSARCLLRDSVWAVCVYLFVCVRESESE
ncbi:unnamed protein product [Pleuronectes platessa]|uniref:Uncharacterized protein n=1 Tax=Pleuronectes platessa TaxID=8262 RepID=A0A9N7YSN5_PLEPL|nr:unnamed protein product [Pleuronectes platessa]